MHKRQKIYGFRQKCMNKYSKGANMGNILTVLLAIITEKLFDYTQGGA